MQLGFVSAILPDLEFEQVLRFAAQTGFDCVEVMCWPVGKADRRYAGVTHLDVTKFDKSQATRAQELAAEAGVSISALGYYPNALSPDPVESAAAVEHLQRVICAAPLLGLTRVTTFVGRNWTQSVDDNWPRFLEVWKPLIRLAEDQG